MKNRQQYETKIPRYGLYGETTLSPEPNFVHFEDISARSSDIGWEILPHRHTGIFQVIYIAKGDAYINLDETVHHVIGPCVITIPTGVVHGFQFKPNTQGGVLSLAETILQDESINKGHDYMCTITRQSQTIYLNTASKSVDNVENFLALIDQEFNQNEKGHELMLGWLVSSFLLVIKRLFGHNEVHTSDSNTSHNQMNRLKSLLNENFSSQWKVQDYAMAMHMSVSTLNRLCNDTMGCSFKCMIQERVLIEAKRKLIYTKISLDQIAYSLGFKDPAYFSRYFKGLVGVPPKEYRNSI